MKPRAFITGVSGFVGPYLVRHLVSSGFDVFGIDRSGNKGVDGCAVEKCDVTDSAAVAAVVKKIMPDFVFHLAGQGSVARSWKDPELTWKVNVEGARNLFEAVAAAKISPRILLVSSAEVYGIPKVFPTPETHPIAPISPYGKSKVEQERIALAHFRDGGIRIVISRSFNHTGPGQPADFVCSNFARQVAEIEKGRQQPIIKVGDPAVKRDFTDVRDVVRAYLLLLQKGVAGEAYNVCSGKCYTIGEVLGKLVKISNQTVKIEQDNSGVHDNAIPVLHGDNSKIRAATGWQPQISFGQTLADLLDYWRAK